MTIKNVPEAKKALKQVYTLFLKELKTSLQVNSLLLQTHTRTTYLRGGTTNTRLRRRTGKLAAATKALSVEKTSEGFKAGLGFGTKYAAIHVGDNRITTIKPKNKQYLAIPLPAAMTKAGVVRGKPLDESVFGDTFIAKSKKNNLIIFGKKVRWSLGGRSESRTGSTYGKITPLFVLKKQVQIKTRVPPKALIKFVRPKIIRDLENVMTKFKK